MKKLFTIITLSLCICILSTLLTGGINTKKNTSSYKVKANIICEDPPGVSIIKPKG